MHRFIFLLCLSFVGPVACDEESKKRPQPAQKKVEKDETPPPPKDEQLAEAPPEETDTIEPDNSDLSGPPEAMSASDLIAACNDGFGRIWDGTNKTCAEAMSKIPCCKEAILASFPRAEAVILRKFKETASEGQTLYNCGEVAGGAYRFHFLETTTDGYDSHFFQIKGVAPRKVADDICPAGTSVLSGDVEDYDGSIDGIIAVED